MAKAGDELVNPMTGLRIVFRKTAQEKEVPKTKGVSKVGEKESKQGRLAVSRRPSESRGLAGSGRPRSGGFRGLGTAAFVLAVLLLAAGGASLVSAATHRRRLLHYSGCMVQLPDRGVDD